MYLIVVNYLTNEYDDYMNLSFILILDDIAGRLLGFLIGGCLVWWLITLNLSTFYYGNRVLEHRGGGGLICNGCIFNSLDCKLKKSEKRHMISRWVPSGSDYQSTISRLQERQREACLRLLYAQASERSFVVNLLHKYSG